MIGSRLVNCLNKLWQTYPSKYMPRYSSGCGNPECKNPKCHGKPDYDIICDPCCPCPPPPEPCCPPPPDPCSCCPPQPEPCCSSPKPDPQPDPSCCVPQPDPCCCPPQPEPPCTPKSAGCPKDPPCPPKPPCCPKDPPCPPKPDPCCPPKPPSCPPKPPCCPKDPPCPPKPPCCPPKPPCCPKDPPCPPKPPCCPPKPPCCPKDPPCPPKPPCCPPKPPCCPKDPPCPPPKPPCCPPKPPRCPKDPPCPPKPPRCPPKPKPNPCCPPKPCPCPKKEPPCPCPKKPPCKTEVQSKPAYGAPRNRRSHTDCSLQSVGDIKPNPCFPRPYTSDCSLPKSFSSRSDGISNFPCEADVDKAAKELCLKALQTCAEARKILDFYRLQNHETKESEENQSGDCPCGKQQEQKNSNFPGEKLKKELNTLNKENQAPPSKHVSSEPKICNRASGKKVYHTKSQGTWKNPSHSSSSCAYCKNVASACTCKKSKGGCSCKKRPDSESKMVCANTQRKKVSRDKSQGLAEEQSSSQLQMRCTTCPRCKQARHLGVCKPPTVHEKNVNGKSITCDGTCPLGKTAGSSCTCIRAARERVKAQFTTQFKATSEIKTPTTACPLCKKDGQQCNCKDCKKSSTPPMKQDGNETKTRGQTCLLRKKPGSAVTRTKSQTPSEKPSGAECKSTGSTNPVCKKTLQRPPQTKMPNVTCPRAKSSGSTCICNKSPGGTNVTGSKLKISESKMSNVKYPQRNSVSGTEPQKSRGSKSTCSNNSPCKTVGKVCPTCKSQVSPESKTCPQNKNASGTGVCIKSHGSSEKLPQRKSSIPRSRSSLRKPAEQKGTTCKSQGANVKHSGSEEKSSNKGLQKGGAQSLPSCEKLTSNASTMCDGTCPLGKASGVGCTCIKAQKVICKLSGTGHKLPTAKSRASLEKLSATKSKTKAGVPLCKKASNSFASVKSKIPRLEHSGSESQMTATSSHCKKTKESCNCRKSQRPYAKRSGSEHRLATIKSEVSCDKLAGDTFKKCNATCPLGKKESDPCTCFKSQIERPGSEIHACGAKHAKKSGSEQKLDHAKSCEKLAGDKVRKCDATCPLGKKQSDPCTCMKSHKEPADSEIHECGAKHTKKSRSEHKLAVAKSQVSCDKLAGDKARKCDATCPLGKKENDVCTCMKSQNERHGSEVHACDTKYAKRSSRSEHKLALAKSQASCEKLAGDKARKCDATCPLGKKENDVCTCIKSQNERPSSEIHVYTAKYVMQSGSRHKLATAKSQTSSAKFSDDKSKKASGICPSCKEANVVCTCKNIQKSYAQKFGSEHKLATIKSQASCQQLADSKPKEMHQEEDKTSACSKPHVIQSGSAKHSGSQFKLHLDKSQGSCGKLSQGSHGECSGSHTVKSQGSRGKLSEGSGTQSCPTCPVCKKDETKCTCSKRTGSSCKDKKNSTPCKTCKKTYSTCTCHSSQTSSEKQPRSRAQSTSAITCKDSQKAVCSCCKLKTLCETDSDTPCPKCQRASKACIEFLCKKYKRVQDKCKLGLRASSPCYTSPESAMLFRRQSIYKVPMALSQRLGINMTSTSQFSSKPCSPPCGGSKSSCKKQTPTCSQNPKRPRRMPGPCRPPTQCKEDPCGEGGKSCGVVVPGCDLLCKLQHVFREQPVCERQEFERYFGDCYQNKEYHMYNKDTFHELQMYMKKYRNCQPSSKNTLRKPPCSECKKC